MGRQHWIPERRQPLYLIMWVGFLMVDWALASHLHPFAGAIVLPDKRQQSSGSTPDPRHHFRCFLPLAPYLTEKEKTGRAEKDWKQLHSGLVQW